MSEIDNNRLYVAKRVLVASRNLLGTCGLLGNIQNESGFKSWVMEYAWEAKTGWTQDTYYKAVNDGTYRIYRYDYGVRTLRTQYDNAREAFAYDYVGFGLAQWTFSSRKLLLFDYMTEFCKSLNIDFDISNIKGQTEYLLKELTSKTYKTVWETICCTKTIADASNAVVVGFERPQGYDTETVQKARSDSGTRMWLACFSAKLTFWFDFNGEWYYCENGFLVTDKWVKYTDGKWYYLDDTGKMIKSKWLKYQDSWYYVGDTGEMLTNAWVKTDDNWYCLDENGEMLKSCEKEIDGETYVFDDKGAWVEL